MFLLLGKYRKLNQELEKHKVSSDERIAKPEEELQATRQQRENIEQRSNRISNSRY